eukprot:12438396-Alexandrium_andersonii.AAC.1
MGRFARDLADHLRHVALDVATAGLLEELFQRRLKACHHDGRVRSAALDRRRRKPDTNSRASRETDTPCSAINNCGYG